MTNVCVIIMTFCNIVIILPGNTLKQETHLKTCYAVITLSYQQKECHVKSKRP